MKALQLLPLALTGSLFAQGAGVTIVDISEIRIDQFGNDDDEYFELAGNPGDLVDGLTYIVIGDGTGGSGVIESVTALTGAIPASGYFVCAESTFTIGVADQTASLNFENSDNVTHLVVEGFSGVSGDDLDTDDDGVLDVTPWNSIIDCVGLVETVGSGDLIYCVDTVGPDGSFVPAHVFDCSGTWNIGNIDIAANTDTPGAANNCGGMGGNYADINEIRVDQSGGDDDEYFELVGTAGDSLDGLSYIVIGDGTGGSGTIENVTSLNGQVMPGSGIFLAGESSMTIGTPDMITSINFENSDNTTHMLVRDFSGTNGMDLDTDDDGVLDSTPWSELLSDVSLVEEPAGGEHYYSANTVGPDGTFAPAHVFYCTDTMDWRIGDFDHIAGDDTPGAVNDCTLQGEWSNYCPATANSFAAGGGAISLTGSANITDNDTVLHVADVPAQFGLFALGYDNQSVAVGNGTLCVAGGTLLRYPVQHFTTNSGSQTLDFTGTGFEASFTAGTTNYFQVWFRDPGQGVGSNVSDALEVTWGQ